MTSFNPVIVGVVIAGEVAKTFAPVPVSSVNAAAKFADVGVAKKVETFVPSPVTLPTATPTEDQIAFDEP